MNFTRFILVCFVAVALSSCLDDGDGVEYGYYYSTIGIIEENGDGGCYVETDTGKKLLVSNPRDVLAEVSDGDKFSNRQKSSFRRLTRGKRFYISRVRAIGPDGIERTLAPMEVIVN